MASEFISTKGAVTCPAQVRSLERLFTSNAVCKPQISLSALWGCFTWYDRQVMVYQL